ncbi:MAG: hypothetical protein ACD_44C00029G0018 [uncultured bacterium]|nr:MAG: hypothetical protein ACD_44C00029G0018 [uncultured bacterium]OGT15897.1 MAG: preprotein translocase subunit YajC [Gammaproteobacteria bacterium RIFCSPHIGHO2_02_FULL_38_33]OGT24592.1 MAG: preprotein translocase subunit YajC [Gammaproteobacteria bacterium RIFCSPHIGHO2_12_38_15]OGT69030.1 MAG: preprotein translocase subunit YajC [Gammaproteobacteria bacterium RIFCSPLOWO2_02_FULL_38_11]OGT75747.1 MAG: preprotein translocase subunit YajC [Gammaproteobacteria bacterium RIFCSPLOWO2_12_FULL_38_
MSLSFISVAHAAGAPASGQAMSGSGMSSMIMLVAFFAIFYFLLWRPQARRAKEHRTLLSSLVLGDEVVTSSGLIGRITKLNENFISLSVGNGVELMFQRSAIASSLPKGTIKNGTE